MSWIYDSQDQKQKWIGYAGARVGGRQPRVEARHVTVGQDNLAEGLLASRKGRRSGYPGRKAGAGGVKRVRDDGVGDGKRRRSQVGTKKIVIYESARV